MDEHNLKTNHYHKAEQESSVFEAKWNIGWGLSSICLFGWFVAVGIDGWVDWLLLGGCVVGLVGWLTRLWWLKREG